MVRQLQCWSGSTEIVGQQSKTSSDTKGQAERDVLAATIETSYDLKGVSDHSILPTRIFYSG